MVSNVILSAYAWAQALIVSFKEERGQDIMEYAVIAGVIALTAAVVLFALDWNGVFNDFFTVVGDCIAFADTCGG